jgi:hypothetical protein
MGSGLSQFKKIKIQIQTDAIRKNTTEINQVNKELIYILVPDRILFKKLKA